MKTRDYIIITIVVVLIILLIFFQDKIKALFTKSKPSQPLTTPQQEQQLDYNKLLKKGVYNSAEVKKLQELLGVENDGDFGPITEAALFNRKGVKEITLNQFATMPDVQPIQGMVMLPQDDGNSATEDDLSFWGHAEGGFLQNSITQSINWHP